MFIIDKITDQYYAISEKIEKKRSKYDLFTGSGFYTIGIIIGRILMFLAGVGIGYVVGAVIRGVLMGLHIIG